MEKQEFNTHNIAELYYSGDINENERSVKRDNE
jgi:hypothetical protein